MKTMALISIKKDGLYEILVTVDNKPYTYQVDGKYAVDKFLGHYHGGSYGKAINVLNKNNERGKAK